MEGIDSDCIDNARLYVDRAKKKKKKRRAEEETNDDDDAEEKKKKKTSSHYEISTIRIVLMMKYFSS